jgi:O-acetylhomoserine (thiol)-lyase
MQIIQGLETLAVRVRNTAKMDCFSSMVRKSRAGGLGKYPGLESSKYYDLAQHYLPKGQNGLLTLV